MIFSELYSAYYNAVAAIIRCVIDGEHSEKELQRIVTERAFGESVMTILPAFKDEQWQLLLRDMTTPLEHIPTMPLTLLQKQWLKAISLDKRIRLFGVEIKGLDGVEPLFTDEDYYVYDKYSDGDNFEDEGYMARFRIILDAIRNKYPVRIKMINRLGQEVNFKVYPKHLEYSEKDDKFRLMAMGKDRVSVNLGRITECHRYYGDNVSEKELFMFSPKCVTISVTDERNALERVMLHFAHFEKRAEKIDDKHYRLNIKYDGDDETELLIRILSFGPLVKVEAPESFVALVRERLSRQMKCNLK